MKSKILILSTTLCAGLIAMNSGCAKLKSKLFQAFTTGSTSVDFTIPVISDTTTKTDWGTVTQNVNLDSIIKKETSNAFSLKDVKSIKISELKMTLSNADGGNNFANFQQGWANFNTDTKPTPITINTGLNPDVYSETWILPTVADVNLKDYVSATKFNYIISAKARRATTKVLNAKLAIKFRVE